MRFSAAVLLLLSGRLAAQSGTIEKGDFRFAYDERGISLLAHARDPFGATLTTAASTGGRGRGGAAAPAATLGLTMEHFEHPAKIVPLSLIMFQLRRMIGLRRVAAANKVGIPVNLFDAMRVVLRKGQA